MQDPFAERTRGLLCSPSPASQLPQGVRRGGRLHKTGGSWLAGDGAQSGPDCSYSTTLGSHREMAGMYVTAINTRNSAR